MQRIDLVDPIMKAMQEFEPPDNDLYIIGFSGNLPVDLLQRHNVEFLRVVGRSRRFDVLVRAPGLSQDQLYRLSDVVSVTTYTPKLKIDADLGRLPYLFPELEEERNRIDARIYARASIHDPADAKAPLLLPLIKVAVRLFPDQDLLATLPVLQRLGLDLHASEEPVDSETLKLVFGYLDLEQTLPDGRPVLEALASLPQVDFIEEVYPFAFLHSAESQEVLQSGDVDLGRPYWDAGIKGASQIVALTDSGLDLDVTPIAQASNKSGNPGPSHRKVVDYRPYGGGDRYSCDGYSHGSNTTQNAVGDRAYLGYDDETDGIAPGGKVFFGDIGRGPTCGNSISPPSNLTTAFQDMYDAGARLENNSWGQLFNTSYNAHAQQADDFMWNHKTFLVFWSAGNMGSVSAPATFKNGVCVGGHHQDPNVNSRYGSYGGAVGGRTAPLVTAPATDSAGIGGNPTPNDYDTSTYWASEDGRITGGVDGYLSQNHSGTSFAAPMAMGAAALIRDYLVQGFYPSGAASAGDAMENNDISGALVKALLINSGEPMTCSGCLNRPNHYVGMGRIVLANTLPLAGNAMTPPSLFIEDRGQATGLQTGEAYQQDIGVFAGADAFRVTLAWTDRAGSSLTNDLRLIVRAPDGEVYYGNNFSGSWSRTERDGGSGNDTSNPFESVMIGPNEVISGTYRLEVHGASVANGDPEFGNSQPFAVIASGHFGAPPPVEVRGLLQEKTSQTGQRLTWEPLFGSDTVYGVYRGTLQQLRNGDYDYLPVSGSCGLGAAEFEIEDLADGQDYYYVAVGRNSAMEGSYGNDSAGNPRPPSASPCP